MNLNILHIKIVLKSIRIYTLRFALWQVSIAHKGYFQSSRTEATSKKRMNDLVPFGVEYPIHFYFIGCP